MRSPTELTMETSVMKGVQKALQRARRRSSLSSSKLFFGNGLSTIFDQDQGSLLWFSWPIRQVVYRLVYYEHTPKSTNASHRRKYCLSTKFNSITRNHDDRFFPYRSEETNHEPMRIFRGRKAGSLVGVLSHLRYQAPQSQMPFCLLQSPTAISL